MNNDSPRIFVPPPLMFTVAVAMGVCLDGNPFQRAHVIHPLQFGGIAFALPGIFLIGAALGLFRRSHTRPEPWEPASALVTGGLYRFTRNPMYLGMALASAGMALFFESLIAAGLLTIVIAVMDRVVIAREEAYLLRRFGAEYAAYRDQVRRWF